MVHRVENVLLHGDVVELVVLEDQVLSDALHSVERPVRRMLDKEHLTECALTDQLLDLEVVEVCVLVGLLLVY